MKFEEWFDTNLTVGAYPYRHILDMVKVETISNF